MEEVKRLNRTFLPLMILLLRLCAFTQTVDDEVDVMHIGVILDMSSVEGKIELSCISMAVSDFYSVNHHYQTRIALHVRDSKGESLLALSSALDLMSNFNMGAIIYTQTSVEARFLIELGDKAHIPVLSFSAPSSLSTSTIYPYLIHISEDETSQVNGIATIIKAFNWKEVILIYENSDSWGGIIPYLLNSLQERNIYITYTSAISTSSTDDQIIEELHKFMAMQTTVFVVHVSHNLVSHLFLNVRRLGMMSEGYTWIMTPKSMNLMNLLDSSIIESMQGAIGLKPYIPTSKELQNFTSRWRRKFHAENPDIEVMEVSLSGLWAYDTIWALAKAAERVRHSTSWKQQYTRSNLLDLENISTSTSGSILLQEILQSRFRGLSGEFQLMSGKLISDVLEIVNVIGKGMRRVGFWTSVGNITKELCMSSNNEISNSSNLEAIIWPGGSVSTPKGWIMRSSSKKLRIGVPIARFKELVSVSRDVRSNETVVTGFCIDVFKACIEALEYEVAYEFIPFQNASGGRLGSYTNLIDHVYYQKFDAVVGDMTILANRSLYVDFTSPYTDLGVGMVARKYSKSMWVFLKPLTADLWLSTAICFIITGFVVWVIECPVNVEFQGSLSQQIGTVLWFSFSTLVFAHREKLLNNLSRFVVIVWVFVVLILTSSYTATLTSMLTVQQIQLNSKGNYIGYQGNSFAVGIFNNLNFQDSRLKPFSSTEEYTDALLRGSKNGGVSAIIDEIPYIKIFLAKYSAQFCLISHMSTTNGFGFVFPKGSPLTADVSRAIESLRQEGKLMMLENLWFHGKLAFAYEDSVDDTNALSLNTFGGLFIISGISSTLALGIFLIPILYKKGYAITDCKYMHIISRKLESLKNWFANTISGNLVFKK